MSNSIRRRATSAQARRTAYSPAYAEASANFRWSLADGLGLTLLVALGIAWPGAGDSTLFTAGVVATGALACLPFTIARWSSGSGPSGITWLPVAAAALLVVWAGLSTVFSGGPPLVSLFGWFGRSDGLILLVGVAALLVSSLALTRSEVDRLVSWLLASAALILFWATLQAFGSSYPPASEYQGSNSSLLNPNFLAAATAILAVLALGRALSVTRPVWERALTGVLALGLVALAFLSQSLQGPVTLAIGAGAAVAAWAVMRASDRRGWAIAGSAVVVAGSLALLVGIVLRWGPLALVREIDTVRLRELYWEAAWRMLQGLPAFGSGPDGYVRYIAEYRTEDFIALRGASTRVSAAHDVPLQYGATLGWIGLIAWLALAASVTIILAWRLLNVTDHLWLYASLVGAWVAYLAQSMISIDFPSLKALGWVLAGMGLAFCLAHPAERPDRRPWTFVASGVVALASVVAFATMVDATSLGPDDDAIAVASSAATPCKGRVAVLKQLYDAGRIPEADPVARAMWADDSRCPALGPLVALVLANAGDLEGARSVAEESVSTDPLTAEAWFTLAVIAEEQGDLVRVQSAVAEAERLDALDASTDISVAIADIRTRL